MNEEKTRNAQLQLTEPQVIRTKPVSAGELDRPCYSDFSHSPCELIRRIRRKFVRTVGGIKPMHPEWLKRNSSYYDNLPDVPDIEGEVLTFHCWGLAEPDPTLRPETDLVQCLADIKEKEVAEASVLALQKMFHCYAEVEHSGRSYLPHTIFMEVPVKFMLPFWNGGNYKFNPIELYREWESL